MKAPVTTFSGTWSGKTSSQTVNVTGQLHGGTTYGKPQTPTSSADSK